MKIRVLSVVLLALSVGCRSDGIETRACVDEVSAGDRVTCELDGFPDRAYDLFVPPGYDGQPVPLVVALHGGGGNRESAGKTTCEGGVVGDESCLYEMANRRGFAMVHPEGIAAQFLPGARTWNAGGGVGEFRCTSGRACEEDVDDVAYLEAVLDRVSQQMSVDVDRVFVTGLSNGGAMSYRLACELSERIAAIVPIGGAMQLTTSHSCEPDQPVPIMHIHGSDDPCWRYDGGVPDCPTAQSGLEHVSVQRTLEEWAALKGCSSDPVQSTLPDTAEDGTSTVVLTYEGCDSDLIEVRIEGGGHTWPNGHQYLGERAIGVVPRDWGNEVILDFFDRLP